MKVLLRFLVFVLMIGLGSCVSPVEDSISLAGSWFVKLDPDSSVIGTRLDEQDFDGKISLPGTTDEAKLGKMTQDTAYGILSREYEYIGPAWYQKNISIPEEWNDKEVTLFLERVLWESRIYLDGKELGMQDALGTPHIHELGMITPGEHTITLRINNDMVHNIGDKGHAYGDYMQSIWNGVIGAIELRADNRTHIENIRIFPSIESHSVRVEMNIEKPGGKPIRYLFRIFEKNSGKKIHEENLTSPDEKLHIILEPDEKVHLWNEFNPFIYELEVIAEPGENLDSKRLSFGFSEVGKSQHHIIINKEKVFLRGNLDCIHFPLTGYPSMDVYAWKKIFRTYKEYGLNHVRFHSWCPPEVAFEAADEIGIYIQAEASVWIDWWMGTDMVARGRPEMDTKGKPQGIGRGDKDADKFIRDEMQRVVDTYGNHPSFIMFCIGNELGSSDFELMGEWIGELKKHDPRRLYAASTARTITPNCDYSATHSVPGIGGVRQRMFNHKNWNYEDQYSRAEVPIIAHEIGQWPVYPDWDEIDKYTGVLKPRNLEQLKNIAAETGLLNQDKEFKEASGKLSALLYKDEIESFMRTPSCAGLQLLSMQDYIGQGEAVIGWLDSFYESKGTLDPDEAKQYLNEIVPLLVLPAYNWLGGDMIEVDVLLHQFGPRNLKNQKITCSLTDLEGNIKYKEHIEARDYQKGVLHEVTKLSIPLPDIRNAGQYLIKLELPGTYYINRWPIWIYPAELTDVSGDVIISNKLDEGTRAQLEDGASVLLLADNLGDPDSQINAAFKPLYWSASFFPGQSIETLGTLIDNEHPALASFPTDKFASWNWWNLCKGAKAFDLTDAPVSIHPIIQPVSDFHFSKRLGSLFEAQIGKGKLMVCGYDLSSGRDSLPEIKQLRHSILEYMNSGDFNPDIKLETDYLKNLFPHYGSALMEVPSGFENAGLYIESAGNQKNQGNSSWLPGIDKIIKQEKLEYAVKADGCWKDDISTAWFGKTMEINLDVPSGSIGKVFLFCHDWSNQNRGGSIDIENRKFIIGKHDGDGKWISLDFMREDTQDGEVKIRIKSSSGPNIMVSKMAVFLE